MTAETIAHERTAVTGYRRWRTTGMETDTTPAAGSWEADKTSPTKASALINTAALKRETLPGGRRTVPCRVVAAMTIRRDLERWAPGAGAPAVPRALGVCGPDCPGVLRHALIRHG